MYRGCQRIEELFFNDAAFVCWSQKIHFWIHQINVIITDDLKIRHLLLCHPYWLQSLCSSVSQPVVLGSCFDDEEALGIAPFQKK